jgi:hypothetical protein
MVATAAVRKRHEEHSQQASYAGLMGLFAAVFAGFSFWKGGDFSLKPFDFLLLALSTFRMGRLMSYDLVFKPIREPVTETVPNPDGAGEVVVPEGTGLRHAVGDLISCPICSGTWAGAGLVYAFRLFPGPARMFMAIMAAAGAAELLDGAYEMLNWGGNAARKQAGG